MQMQQRGPSGMSPAWLAAGIVLSLAAAGCDGGGSGSASSFGGSSFSGTLGGVVVGGDGTLDLASVATVHSPEPGSLAVFGGGLAGLALWRRRKAKALKQS